MKSPDYYIQKLELDIDPNLTDIDFGATSLDFEVDDIPKYDEELGGLLFESEFELTLNCYSLPIHDSVREDQEEVGHVNSDVLIFIEGEENEFTEFMNNWEENGYRSTDWDYRYHIESGIITDVFAPIASLVQNSYRGVLPGVAFTEPPMEDTEKLPVERTDFAREYLGKNIEEKLLEYLRENHSDEVGDEELIVEISDDWSSVKLLASDEIEEFGRDHQEDMNSIISEIYEQVVQELSDDELESSRITIVVGDTEVGKIEEEIED